MESVKLSLEIVNICKQLGIEYTSVNPKATIFLQDASRLGEIYLQLKIIIGDLKEIEERHHIEGLASLFDDDIQTLNKIDHDINRVAMKIRDEQKEGTGNEKK